MRYRTILLVGIAGGALTRILQPTCIELSRINQYLVGITGGFVAVLIIQGVRSLYPSKN